MNTVEDRLKAATRAAADTVADNSAPRLRLAATPVARHRLQLSTRRVMTWAAPVTAGIAVLAVVIPTAVWHDDRTTQLGVITGRAAAIPPPYYVALSYVGQFSPRKIERTKAIVGLTASGKPIVTISPPASFNAFVRVSAAANGRKFVLAAQNLSLPNYGYPTRTRFYELTVFPKGSRIIATMYPLPTPVLTIGTFTGTDGIALSPDASKLAVTDGAPGGLASPAVHVYETATGRERTWAVPTKQVGATPTIQTPSWEANGRYLALDVSTREPSGKTCLDCVRLLDTATQGGNLLNHSRVLVRPPQENPNASLSVQWLSSLITPDGNHVLRSVIVPTQLAKNTFSYHRWTYEYNAWSGALSGFTDAGSGGYWYLMWSSSDGQAYIATTSARNAGPGVLAAVQFADGRWHPVPLPPHTITVAW